MQRCEPILVDHFELRSHGKDIGESELCLRVASPVQRRTATIVRHIDIHVLHLDEVVKRTGLVSLRRHMQYVCTVYVLSCVISMHLFHHDPYQINVAMVCREMQRRKALICRHIDPIREIFAL